MYRKYYKFGTTINGIVTGSPTINNGVVSGFSSSKYITSTLPIPQGGINTFEIYTKITTPSTLNAYGAIIGPSKDGTHFISFETQYSGEDDSIALVFYDNDTYWGYQAKSSDISASTTYWCKWIYDGTNVKGYYSSNGNIYTLVSTTASSSQLTNALSKFITSDIRIGCSMSGESVNNGSIDLTQTYIKINGNIVWSGTNIEEGTSSDYIFYKDFYNYKAKKESVIHYYRYIGSEESWTQPSISANGTLGGDSFAVAASGEGGNYKAYQAFTSTGWINGTSGGNGYLIFYNPNALKVTSLTFASDIFYSFYIKTYDLYGSKDNSTWDLIGSYTQGSGTITNTIENTEFYNYYKIQSTSVNRGAGIKNLVITATQGSSTVEESLEPFNNVDIIGNPVINKHRISGFSANNYLKTIPAQFTSVTATANNWEMVFKFTYIADSNYQNIWCQGIGASSKLDIRNVHIHMEFTNTDFNTPICQVEGITTLIENNDYYIKAEFTGTAYNLYLSADGKNWNLEGTANSSTKISDRGTNAIGVNIGDGSNYKEFKGSIDLSGCYIKVNGAYWWKGVDYDFEKDIPEYKVKKITSRHYYKIQYESWTQPILSSNTTSTQYGDIIVSASNESESYPAYRAFDGIKSGSSGDGQWSAGNYSKGWLQIEFPYKLKITNIDLYNGRSDDTSCNVIKGAFYTDFTLTTQIGNTLSTPTTNWYETNAYNGSGIITDTLYLNITGSNNSWIRVGEIEITATKQVLIESTSDDYDFYEDVVEYSAIKV